MSEALAETARQAFAAWNGNGPVRPISNRENAVFDVALNGRRAALRLHRPGYQTEAAIRSELWWCAALADAGFPAPRPIPTPGGDLTAPAADRLASLIEWCPGTPMGAANTPLAGTPAEQIALFSRLGDLTARLHEATDALTLPPDFERPRWDADAFLGDQPLWGRFWDNPSLSDPESAFLHDARTAARAELDMMGQADFGLIHSDILRENVLVDGQDLWLIDYDDSGFGWRYYDLATAVSHSLEEPAFPAFVDAVLNAYAKRRPLPADAHRRLTLFTMLRNFASCGWVITRCAPDDPRIRRQADRALRVARLWMDGGTLGRG